MKSLQTFMTRALSFYTL